MSKRLFILAALAAAAISPARAADNLPAATVKPAATSFLSSISGGACTPTTCTGFYFGGGLGGVGTNLDIIGQGLQGSAAAGGMLPTAKFGYLYAQNNWLFGAEASFAYQTSSSVAVAAASGNQSGALFTQGVKFGGNMAALLGTAPVVPVTIPPALANAVISLYLQGGAAEHSVSGGSFVSGEYSGAGVLFDTGPHSFIDVDYKNIQYGAAKSGAATFNSENVVTASWNYKF